MELVDGVGGDHAPHRYRATELTAVEVAQRDRLPRVVSKPATSSAIDSGAVTVFTTLGARPRDPGVRGADRERLCPARSHRTPRDA